MIGKVIGSERASLGRMAVPNSSAVLNGDLLTTGPKGKALVEFSHAMRASLSENTSVRFTGQPGRVLAKISSGQLVAEAGVGKCLAIATPKYKVEPASHTKTTYMVALASRRSTVVAAGAGGVAITEIASGRTYVLPAGKYATIAAAASGVPGQQNQG